MAVFAYRGLAADGRAVSGVVDADTARTARSKLRESGVFPTDISEEAGIAQTKEASAWAWLPKFGHRMPAGELALLSRQLGSLLGAGVQLVDAFGALADQATRPWVKKILSQVRERVREGSSLADALADHGDVFSDLYVAMVRAGEAAGALEVVLERLAEYSERQAEFIAKVRGALTYPAIMALVGTGIMGFLVSYVVPQVATIFAQTKQSLPLATQILIALSGFIADYWLELFTAIVAIAAGIAFGLSTPRGRAFYDRMTLRLPYLGALVTKTVCARFARTLGTLLASGVQLLPALDAVKLVVTNTLLADAIAQSRNSIREGHGMGQTLAQSKLFPPMLIEMIRVGERSGELEAMLARAADIYEREVSSSLSQVTTILEPVMTLGMAGVIVFMMMAVLMPIMQLNQLVQ